MRTFLRDLWSSYKDGQTSLIVASFLTTQAVDVVKDLEADFFSRFGSRIHNKTFHGALEVICGTLIDRHSSDALLSFLSSIHPEQADFIFLETWISIERYGQNLVKDPKEGLR